MDSERVKRREGRADGGKSTTRDSLVLGSAENRTRSAPGSGCWESVHSLSLPLPPLFTLRQCSWMCLSVRECGGLIRRI